MSRYLDGAPLAHLGLVVDVFGTGAGGRERRQSNSCSSFPLYRAIASLHHLPDEAGVVVGGVEIAAAPQDEGLVDGVLEAVVGVLGDAVFMALAGIDAGGSGGHSGVQQGGVIVVKSAARLLRNSWVAAAVLSLRTTSGTPPRVQRAFCNPCLQGQEGLAGGDLGVAPSRVAEYQLEQQVGVGLSGDGHLEFPAVGEVELGLQSRRMHLGEVHLLIRTMQRPPILQSSLQGAQLGRAERQGCCSASQSIIVVAFSLPVGSFRSSGSISSSPTPSKGSGRVRHRCSGFACDGNGPLCHLRAERTLIPALAPAVSCVLPSIRFCLNSLTCRVCNQRYLRTE